ncbi:MAG: hypothetical protein LBC81_01270 [Tannerellaceae bacterium]|jgi:hypothetical protein|nr:hypothetical protein [Tannerellaceae bacterium]
MKNFNNKQETVYIINQKGVTVRKINDDGDYLFRNMNKGPVEVSYRIFGMRNDNYMPDLLVNDNLTLGKSNESTAIRQLITDVKTIPDVKQIYYTIVIDINVKRTSDRK